MVWLWFREVGELQKQSTVAQQKSKAPLPNVGDFEKISGTFALRK